MTEGGVAPRRRSVCGVPCPRRLLSRLIILVFALARGLPTPDATIENRYVDVAGWSKGFIGMLGSVSYIFAAIFVVIFASSLKHVRFRKILIVLQICSSLLSALDLILVCVAKDALWGYVRRTVLVCA